MEATRAPVHQAAVINAESRADRSVSVEYLAYICLAILALVLRVADLDSLPLNDAEARQALHAWHSINDNVPGSYVSSGSPLVHISQLISFSLLGAKAFSARLLPMLAGWLLTLTPLLFRDVLGRTRAFVWACLLSLLTLPIASSRLAADGNSFMMLFALLAVWMIRRYWYSQRLSDARWAVALVTLMTLLSAPAGIPLLAVMLVAGWLAVWRTAISAPQRLDLPGDDILKLAMRRLRAFPLLDTAFVPVAVVILVSTLFMLHPGGLSTVGALIEASLAGITQNAGMDGLRLGFAALVAHEPLLVIFALGGAWLLWRQGAITYIDRFAAAWAGIGALALLLYPGAAPADGMWVALPLTLLASYGITQLMVDRRVVLLWDSDENGAQAESDADELYTTAYWWVKWLIAGIVLALLLVISTQFMEAARLMLSLPESAPINEILSQLSGQARLLHALGMMALLSVVLAAVCLLLANYWGAATTLQGIGLGFLGLTLLSGAGGGWAISAADPANPNGLWRQNAINGDVKLLRETLHELSLWRADGFATLPFTVVEDQASGITRDGLAAWLLRDYPNATFVPHPAQAAEEPIVLTADDESHYNLVAGDYVGQRFLLRRGWSVASQSVWDLPAWWTQNRRRDEVETDNDALMLWLRQDIYDGAKLDQAN